MTEGGGGEGGGENEMIEMIVPPYWTLDRRLPGSEAAPSHAANPAPAPLPAMLPSNAICMSCTRRPVGTLA